jgi:cytidylate kinase
MSWSIKGIRRLLCVRLLVLEGKLTSWLSDKAGDAVTYLSVEVEKRRETLQYRFQQQRRKI